MNIEPSIVFGAIAAGFSALATAIVALFRIVTSYSDDLKVQRDRSLALSEEQSKQISELVAHQDKLARALETLTYGLERWGVPPNVVGPGTRRRLPPSNE